MTGTIFIRKNDRHVKVLTTDILFIQAQGSYLELVTRHDKFSVSLNLSQFLRKNPIENLIRIHRSFIINIHAIDAFDHRFVYLGRHQLPIGDSFRTDFIKDLHSI
jgi:DNA-binding LytR/AlgR family response regulator